jgi:aminoglycoside 6'-N-acetyltransferase I
VNDRDEWLRMRVALWPEEPRESLKADDIPTGNAAEAVFVAVRSNGKLGGFLEASLRPFAAGCITHPVGYIEGWFVDADVALPGNWETTRRCSGGMGQNLWVP